MSNANLSITVITEWFFNPVALFHTSLSWQNGKQVQFRFRLCAFTQYVVIRQWKLSREYVFLRQNVLCSLLLTDLLFLTLELGWWQVKGSPLFIIVGMHILADSFSEHPSSMSSSISMPACHHRDLAFRLATNVNFNTAVPFYMAS